LPNTRFPKFGDIEKPTETEENPMKYNGLMRGLMVSALCVAGAASGAFAQDRMALYKPFGEIPVPSKEYRIGVIMKTLNNAYFIDLKTVFKMPSTNMALRSSFLRPPVKAIC
jgi:hypothetical protein